MLADGEAAEALALLDRLLSAVDAGRLDCSAAHRERLTGVAEALGLLLEDDEPYTN